MDKHLEVISFKSLSDDRRGAAGVLEVVMDKVKHPMRSREHIGCFKASPAGFEPASPA